MQACWLFSMYVPSIIHDTLKTLVASCLFASVLCVNLCVCACVGTTRSIGGCVFVAWGGFFGMTGFSGLISLQIYHAWRMTRVGERERKTLGRRWRKGERFQYSIWDADSVQTRGERGLRTASSTCCAKRKCIIINIKTRCFHSIRDSLKTFDKVEWTSGGLCSSTQHTEWKTSLNWRGKKNRKTDMRTEQKRRD